MIDNKSITALFMIIGIFVGVYQSVYDCGKFNVFIFTSIIRSVVYGISLGVFAELFREFSVIILVFVSAAIPFWYYVHSGIEF